MKAEENPTVLQTARATRPGRPALQTRSRGVPGPSCGGFLKLDFGGAYNGDYSILGSILRSPYFGKLPCLYV